MGKWLGKKFPASHSSCGHWALGSACAEGLWWGTMCQGEESSQIIIIIITAGHHLSQRSGPHKWASATARSLDQTHRHGWSQPPRAASLLQFLTDTRGRKLLVTGKGKELTGLFFHQLTTKLHLMVTRWQLHVQRDTQLCGGGVCPSHREHVCGGGHR